MIISSGFALRHRGIAKYSTPKERQIIVDYVSRLPGKVAIFDNTQMENVLIVDFDDREEWNEFNEIFFHKRKKFIPSRSLKVVSQQA